MAAPTSYAAPAAFYAADPRRKRSREEDLGLWWRAEGGSPTFRAAWVEETGEVYLVQHGPWPGAGQVSVLARFADRAKLEARLAGWREMCGREGSLRWLGDRLSEWRARATA